ncbi:hypothetical protein DV737_g1472, partial [Chaetothyriales sp. CBS 132003]
MPSTSFSLSPTTLALPQWQVIFFLAHLSHTDIFPNVNHAALANAMAAAIARGINLSEEQVDGLVRRFLNLSRAEKVALRSMEVSMIGPRQQPGTTGLARSTYTWTRNAEGEEIITIIITPNRQAATTPSPPRTRLEADIDKFFEQWKIHHPADFPASGLVQPPSPQPSSSRVDDLTAFLEGASESITSTAAATTAVNLPQLRSASPSLAAASPQQTSSSPQTTDVPFQPILSPRPVVAPLSTNDLEIALADDELLTMDAETEAIINNHYYTFKDNMAFLEDSAALTSDSDSGGGTATQLPDGLVTPPSSPPLW